MIPPIENAFGGAAHFGGSIAPVGGICNYTTIGVNAGRRSGGEADVACRRGVIAGEFRGPAASAAFRRNRPGRRGSLPPDRGR
jgi:hypothetical protein